MATDSVEQIKDKLSIVEVISPYVKLTKAGKYWRGLSPFNKEKTPSFYVSPDRGSYYCFSSSQGGDIFTFVEKMEGVDFRGALKILAEKAGISLQETGKPKDKEKLERMRELMTRAEEFFKNHLNEKGEQYAYALSRGVTKETIEAWGLGFAPDGWRTLLEHGTTMGFSVAEMTAVGLVKEADEKKGTWYDRFRNRLMFPIKDAAGRTVAFTGRALAKDDPAKYLNSPETELFKKSEVLFGMHAAKEAIRTRGFALLVEGQFDLVLLHQIGFQNTIALSGTALSSIHLGLIKRYTDNLMLALDADRAGLAASAKNAMAALSHGMKVKAVRLPEGKDPADLASSDPKEFTKRVQNSESIIEFFLSVLSDKEKDEHKLVLAVEKIVLPFVASIKSPLEREHFVSVVAKAINSTVDAVRTTLPKAGTMPSEPAQNQPIAIKKAVAPTSSIEYRTELIQAIIAAYDGTPLAKRLKDEYARIIGTPFVDFVPSERMLFEAGLAFGETPSEHSADDLIRAFEKAYLTQKLEEAMKRLKQAELAKDEIRITDIVNECKDISKQLSAF